MFSLPCTCQSICHQIKKKMCKFSIVDLTAGYETFVQNYFARPLHGSYVTAGHICSPIVLQKALFFATQINF